MNGGIKITVLFFFIISSECIGQINSGKIIYERKTNLLKKYKNNNEWIKERNIKDKIDFFELTFNDSLSAYKPQESELKEQMSWTTSKNQVYQNLNSKQSIQIKNIWGENFYVVDSLRNREWKITNSKREISGYMCRKAIWQANDSTTIYAWYTDFIVNSIGPETFTGLPGAILGLATEDGGVVFYAKKIEVYKPKVSELEPEKMKKKTYSYEELKTMVMQQYKDSEWGERLLQEHFGVW